MKEGPTKLALSELIERAEAAKRIEDTTARRVELRAIYAGMVSVRFDVIEQHLGIHHEELERLQEALVELNQSFTDSE